MMVQSMQETGLKAIVCVMVAVIGLSFSMGMAEEKNPGISVGGDTSRTPVKYGDKEKEKKKEDDKKKENADFIIKLPNRTSTVTYDSDSRRVRHLENEVDDLEDDNDRLRRKVNDLQSQLSNQENINKQIVDKVKSMDREIKNSQNEKDDELEKMREQMLNMTRSAKQSGESAARQSVAALRMAMDSEWEWGYDLMRDEQMGEMYFQHEDGKTSTQRFWSVNRKKIGVRSMFQNTSERTGKFFLKFAVVGKEEVEGIPETGTLLGTTVYTTPELAPGETCEFTKWVPVKNSNDVRSVKVVGVMRRFEVKNAKPNPW
ncbi:hypothetical protein JD969_05915 [Planctomycetota bacterium]|nr:hypothetical protein JD969_05915 [Planctomycetota bacterium]